MLSYLYWREAVLAKGIRSRLRIENFSSQVEPVSGSNTMLQLRLVTRLNCHKISGQIFFSVVSLSLWKVHGEVVCSRNAVSLFSSGHSNENFI